MANLWNRLSQTHDVVMGFYGIDERNVGCPVYDLENLPNGSITRLTVAGRPFDYYGRYMPDRLERQNISVPHQIEIPIERPPSMIYVIQSSGLAVLSDGSVFINPEMASPEKWNITPLVKLLYEGAKEKLEKL